MIYPMESTPKKRSVEERDLQGLISRVRRVVREFIKGDSVDPDNITGAVIARLWERGRTGAGWKEIMWGVMGELRKTRRRRDYGKGDLTTSQSRAHEEKGVKGLRDLHDDLHEKEREMDVEGLMAIASLTRVEEEVIYFRFYRGLAYDDIGWRLKAHVTGETVRRIEKSALQKLRQSAIRAEKG